MAETKLLYELEVSLLGGPLTDAFVNKNPTVSRTIQIRSDQTLEDLHEAIFKAFGRFDEHMYEFQIGGKGPEDRKAIRYVLSVAMDDDSGPQKIGGDVADTEIGSLGLKVNQAFGYWFDFGDDWWHQITVVAIHNKVPRGRYPKVTQKVGQSPPQYIDWDEEESSDEE